MELQNVFTRLANSGNHRGLMKLAQTLEDAGDLELSDMVVAYANVASENALNRRLADFNATNRRIAATAAQNANSRPRIIDGPMKEIFENVVNAFAGTNFTLDKLPYVKGVFQILQNPEAKKGFFDSGYHFYTVRHDISKDSARKRLNRAWDAFVKYIHSNYKNPLVSDKEFEDLKDVENLNYSTSLKLLAHVAEGVLRSNHVDFQLGAFLDPHNPTFYEVFGPRSPLREEVYQQLVSQIGEEKTQRVFQAVQEEVAHTNIDRKKMSDAVKQYRKTQTNRAYGILGQEDLELITEAIELTDSTIDPRNVFNSATEDHWKFFDGWNLPNFREQLFNLAYQQYDEEVKAHEVSDRLYRAVLKINQDNTQNNPHYKAHEQQYRDYLVQQGEKERQRQEQEALRREKEKAYQESLVDFSNEQDSAKTEQKMFNDVNTLIKNREQMPSYEPTKKKWWQFWKQASIEEAIDEVLGENDGLIRVSAKGDKHPPLNKPKRTPGGPKKFTVYVKDERGKVKKVNFGDPNLSIKRDNPERRKNFRARHRCDDPGPKTKARYWSCKMWESDKSVGDVLGD